jgi:hypothetical protein
MPLDIGLILHVAELEMGAQFSSHILCIRLNVHE